MNTFDGDAIIDGDAELQRIFEEYAEDKRNPKRHEKYARVIALLLWPSYVRFLGENELTETLKPGNGVGRRFAQNILMNHSKQERREVMDYFHGVNLSYLPNDIKEVLDTFKSLKTAVIERSHFWNKQEVRLHNILKAAAIYIYYDVFFGSKGQARDRKEEFPKYRNFWNGCKIALETKLSEFWIDPCITLEELKLIAKILWKSN